MKKGNRNFCLLTGAAIIAIMYVHQWVLVNKVKWDDASIPILYMIYLFIYYLHLFARVSKIRPPSGPDPAALIARTLIFLVIVCLFVSHTIEHGGSGLSYSGVFQIIVSFIIELLLPEYILRMIFFEEEK